MRHRRPQDPAALPRGLNYAAANIDPAVFDDPKEFRPDRSPNPHVGFGHGPHTCVGAPPSRTEIRLAVEYVLERLPDIELAVSRSRWRTNSWEATSRCSRSFLLGTGRPPPDGEAIELCRGLRRLPRERSPAPSASRNR
ncbi:MAG: cytochrome P450 [Solirubrobacterales bacterium]|nr:cytochrome P450 [Solirubrobacterales bacterium]